MRQPALALATLLVTLSFAATARAASTRVYVASAGADSGACARTAPCKTIPYAMTQVLARGEVVVLDSSTYPAFNVTKSVTIMAAPGAAAVVGATAAGLTAVAVTIAQTDVVVLRGLTLTGQGAGDTGIRFNGAGVLHVEDCVVSGFVSQGIFQSASGRMYVRDTTVRDGRLYGIRMFVNDGEIVASVDHCRVDNILGAGAAFGVGVAAGNNAYVSVTHTVSSGIGVPPNGPFSVGFAVGGSGRMTVSGSAASAHFQNFLASEGGTMDVSRSTAGPRGLEGFTATTGGKMNIDASTASGCGRGIRVQDTDSVVRVSNTLVSGNATGLSQGTGGTLVSRGNNNLLGNTFDQSGTITLVTGAQ